MAGSPGDQKKTNMRSQRSGINRQKAKHPENVAALSTVETGTTKATFPDNSLGRYATPEQAYCL
jgi:hypothetical protein